jgi:hypothetical protein
MAVRLAGLSFVIGGHLHIHISPGVGSLCHSFFLCFFACLRKYKLRRGATKRLRAKLALHTAIRQPR